jgi:hypothetical protein
MGVGKGNMWVGERVGVGMRIGERGKGKEEIKGGGRWASGIWVCVWV